MARPFVGNWACDAIADLVKPDGDAKAIAAALAEHPRFIATIQDVLDDWPDPIPYGSDPKELIIADLSAELVQRPVRS